MMLVFSSPRIRTMIRLFFFASVLILLNSCGFQLRGSMDYGVENVYVQSDNADILANQVKQYLKTQSNITLTSSQKKADVVVLLSNQKFDRRVLTISAVSGRLEEVELNFKTDIEIRQSDDTILLEEQTLSYIRDYSYDAFAALAMGSEEEMLRKELLQEATMQVLRMLQVVSQQLAEK